MQARKFLNYRFKDCWPKVIYFICQPKELKQEIRKNTGGVNLKYGGSWLTQAA